MHGTIEPSAERNSSGAARFRIIGDLASGGMARLSLALQSGAYGFERVVALKRLFPHYQKQPDLMEMFIHEANIAARLDHPNIARVYGLEEIDGQVAISMEYLPGEDLGTLLRKSYQLGRPAPIREILTIVAACGAALDAAHGLIGADGKPINVVHRDVSPSNIVVTYHGVVKLLDFGVAKARTRLRETKAGTFKGKLTHTSPEQIAGMAVDHRTDIFCLGITLWELLVGRRLFAGNNQAVIVDRVRSQKIVAPSSLRAEVPHEVDRVVLKALQRDPNARFQTAAEMTAALRECLGTYGGPASPDELRSCLEETVGSERAKLKLAIAQGLEPEKNLEKLNALLTGPDPVDQAESGAPLMVSSSSSLRIPGPLRIAWSTDLGGGIAPPSRKFSPRQWRPETVPPPASSDSLVHRETAELEFTTGPDENDENAPPPPKRGRLFAAVAVGAVAAAAVAFALMSADEPQANVVKYGAVAVTSTPPGAAVFLDGQPTGALTPTTIDTAVLGRSVTIGVQKDGFVSSTETIVVETNNELDFKMKASTGSVFFTGVPSGARVYVDGEEVGTNGAIVLSIGSHALRVESGDQLLGEKKFEVRAGRNDVSALKDQP